MSIPNSLVEEVHHHVGEHLPILVHEAVAGVGDGAVVTRVDRR